MTPFPSSLNNMEPSCANGRSRARAAFVAARGYGFGTAREIALKVAEILRVPALGYSAAELQHGPPAPVLLLRPNDETAATVDELISDLSAAGETVFCVGGPHGTLPGLAMTIRSAMP